jgi:hypothetical protein
MFPEEAEWPESLEGLDCANAERTALGVFFIINSCN